MKRILLSTLAALALAASAHAITYDVRLFGGLEEQSRLDPDITGIPVLDTWEYTFDIDLPSAPADIFELFAAMNPGSVGSFGTFRVFDEGSLYASRALPVIQVYPGEILVSAGWSSQTPTILTSWAWTAVIEDDVMNLDFNRNGLDRLVYGGTVNMEVSAAAIPDTGSTAALLGVGLFGFFLIRRRLG